MRGAVGKSREEPKWNALRRQVLKLVSGSPIKKKRAMTCGNELDLRLDGIQKGHDISDKSLAREIFHQEFINVTHHSLQVLCRGKAGSRVCSAYGHDERRPNTMPRDICQRNCDLTTRQLLPIEIIASGRVRRQVPAGNVELSGRRRMAGQQALLDGARYIEILLDPLDLAARLRFLQ